MIINANIFGSGGGEEPYGFLFVNYPADAVLSVTNVHPQFEQIGSGQRLYFVNKPTSGDSIICVATITKTGESPKSESVVFDEIGQSKSVMLEFNFSVFPPATNWETLESGTKVAISDSGIKLSWNGNNGQAHTINTVDLTGRSTLFADFVIDQVSGSGSGGSASVVRAGILTDKSQATPNWTKYAEQNIYNLPVGTEFTLQYSLPVGTTNQYYIGVGGRYNVYVTCRKVYVV